MLEADYGLVGRGRLATHLAHYLSLEGLRVRQWHRACAEPPEDVLSPSDPLLLAISDDQIEAFIKQHAAFAGKRIVHFSGCLTIPGTIGLHPLMTFGPELYSLETYRRIPFIGENGAPRFEEVFPTLRNPEFSIPAEQKPLYHALCVISGNLPMLLWNMVLGRFHAELGLPNSVIEPYLSKCLENALSSEEGSVTGPLIRKDVLTIEQNLSALGEGRCSRIYKLFAEEIAGVSI